MAFQSGTYGYMYRVIDGVVDTDDTKVACLRTTIRAWRLAVTRTMRDITPMSESGAEWAPGKYTGRVFVRGFLESTRTEEWLNYDVVAVVLARTGTTGLSCSAWIEQYEQMLDVAAAGSYTAVLRITGPVVETV